MENQLKHSENPYLRMHMDQEIHWYPWCAEAFKKAKSENKPIFLSIGYSTCHWCHVMAEESFDDIHVAQKLNDSFISIKVDREEHPEVDSVYMNFCQALTGSGGWPLSVFMTPDQKPFFAGTYFPKRSSKKRIGFLEILDLISEKWKSDRKSITEQAEFILEEVTDLTTTTPQNLGEKDIISDGLRYLKLSYDRKNGGFGNAPKFPTPHKLYFLLNIYEKEKSPEILKMLETTAIQMAKGGIFDHIGGGFCRYSTDPYFLIPHFEKMLYDNALLIIFYSGLYELTRKDIYLQIAESISNYLCHEMKSPDGGFFTAQDADIGGMEGVFYAFTREEIYSVLGEKEGACFCEKYQITEKGNFEGKNIPNLLNRPLMDNDFSLDDPNLQKASRV